MDQAYKSLLEELARASLPNLNEIHAAKFRAQHREHLDKLNRLEWDGYIDNRMGNKYKLTLLGLSEILSSVAELQILSQRFEKLFGFLKQHYEANYGERISLNDLSKATGLTTDDLNIVLTFMVQAPLFGTRSSDFLSSENAFVSPSEDILKYQSFNEVLEEMRARPSTHLQDVGSEGSNDNIGDFEFLLHPAIIRHALPQYRDGHLRDAVFNSVIAVFDLIRERTALKLDGDALVEAALSLHRPRLILGELDSPSGKDDQKGFIQILKGAFQGIRNPKAHSLSHDLNRLKAAQYLVFASLLARRIDEAIIPKKEET
jgi:uncharacterized protein (TIGR02391 family)